jgi:hypothetical protein
VTYSFESYVQGGQSGSSGKVAALSSNPITTKKKKKKGKTRNVQIF